MLHPFPADHYAGPPGARPFCALMSCLDNWGVTKGNATLVQQKEATRTASMCIGPEGDMHNVSTAKCNIGWPGPSIR